MKLFTTLQLNVTTAGTPQALPDTEIPAEQSILVKAKSTNTGLIYIGNSSAHALNHAVAFSLAANEAIELDGDNANQIWLDAAVSGEGVECIISN